MVGHCKDCRFFDVASQSYLFDDEAECDLHSGVAGVKGLHSLISYAEDDHNNHADWFVVKANFGCVQFQAREEVASE